MSFALGCLVWTVLMAAVSVGIRVARYREDMVDPALWPVEVACPWCGAGLAVCEGQVAVCECGNRVQVIEPKEVD